MNDNVFEQWEANADAFSNLIDNQGTPHHRQILNPCTERLIGDVIGKRLLDAGCGEGYLSRHYARKGAIVTGIDISPKMINNCMTLTVSGNLSIEYKVGDICSLDCVNDAEFDIVLSNLVLLNVPCLYEALREFHRILKNRGELIFSIVHPAFNIYGPGKWEMGEKDEITQRRRGMYFKVDNYYDELEYEHYWKTRNGQRFPQPIGFYHRTLSTYFDALIQTGFSITAFEEPEPIIDDAFFEREKRIPIFAVFKAKRA